MTGRKQTCNRCGHLRSLHGAVGPARKNGLPNLDPCDCCDKQARGIYPWQALLQAARLAGWAARPRDPQVLTVEQVDAISRAAANAALDLLAEWEAQSATASGHSPASSANGPSGLLKEER